jgi:hypothetical protein
MTILEKPVDLEKGELQASLGRALERGFFLGREPAPRGVTPPACGER